MDIKKDVAAFIFIVFLLVGGLLGVQISAFISGNLDASVDSAFDDSVVSVVNLTGAFINSTNFTISEASVAGFNGGFTVTSATNSTNGFVIPVSNYTVNAVTGSISNATAFTFPAVNLTYTFIQKTNAEVVANQVGNQTLQSLSTYSSGASTQMNTISISITIALLIALFVFFMRAFIGKRKGGSNGFA